MQFNGSTDLRRFRCFWSFFLLANHHLWLVLEQCQGFKTLISAKLGPGEQTQRSADEKLWRESNGFGGGDLGHAKLPKNPQPSFLGVITYNPYSWGVKPGSFMGLGSKGTVWYWASDLGHQGFDVVSYFLKGGAELRTLSYPQNSQGS